MKTDDGNIKGKISFYCRALDVSRQAFYDYLEGKNKPWKYKSLADEMMKIHNEDKYNDCYGRKRMYMALLQKKEAGEIDIDIPSESTVYKKEADRLSRLAQQKRDSQRTVKRYLQNEQAAKKKKGQLE